MNGIEFVFEDGWIKIRRENGPEMWFTPEEWEWLRTWRLG